MGKPTYDELKEKYDELIEEKFENEFIIDKLAERIYSAIKFINENSHFDKWTKCYFPNDDDFDVDTLRRILRGEK